MTSNWNLLGNEWAVDMLREQIAHHALHHAYLIAGPPGIGRRTLALRFAQALNCSNPPEPGVPCGTCRDCIQIDRGEHPDLKIIQGVRSKTRGENDEAEDVDEAEGEDSAPEVDPLGNVSAGLRLKVGQIRRNVPYLNFKPYSRDYRVAIFLRFQEATNAAASALLKTLEEAPPSTILILTADTLESVLPTIASRCEVLRLQPLPVENLQSFLKERGATDEQARLIAHVSGGRPGFALRLLEQPGAMAYRDAKLRELASLLRATRAQRFAYAKKLSEEKATIRTVLAVWLSFWRDVFWRASGTSTPIANIDREPEIDAIVKSLDLRRARALVSDLDKALQRLDANVNARLLAEVLLLDWPRP